MLIRLFRWFLGYVKFRYSGGFKEDFINDCYNSGVDLKNICLNGDDLTADTRIKTYKLLHRIAFSHGGTVKIYKKKGFPFIFSPIHNRWGFFAGIVYLVFFISFMGGFVWNITVTGNNRVTEVKIVDYLAKNGFKIGTRWSDTDKEGLETSIMSDFEDVAWISINKIGSTASVEINETVAKPEITDNNITNVKAKKDGVIVRVITLGGWAEIKEGDAVTEGDLLISGVRESEVDKKNHYAHAHGNVFAQVSSEISMNINRKQNRKDYTNSREYKALSIFGMEIPLFIKKDGEDAEISINKTYLVINSYRLPFGIITQTADYYNTETDILSDEALEELAKSELEKKKEQELKNCEILTENINVEINENDCVITGRYSYIQDIGEETEILFNDEE